MLAEPKTLQSVSALLSYTKIRQPKIIIHYHYWIGMDDLKNKDGQFRYSSSGVKVPRISGITPYLNNRRGDQDCARLYPAFSVPTRIDDHTCDTRYPSICEASLTTKGQLMSKCPFGVFKSPKKTTKIFPGFLP